MGSWRVRGTRRTSNPARSDNTSRPAPGTACFSPARGSAPQNRRRESGEAAPARAARPGGRARDASAQQELSSLQPGAIWCAQRPPDRERRESTRADAQGTRTCTDSAGDGAQERVGEGRSVATLTSRVIMRRFRKAVIQCTFMG